MLPELHAMSGGGIDIDASALISAGIFLLLYLFLRKTLFQPYLDITAKREALTGGAMDEAEALLAQAADLEVRYETLKASAAVEAAGVRDALRSEAKLAEEAALADARKAAAVKLGTHREALSKQIAVAEAQIETRARELSASIVTRLSPEVR